MKDKTAEQAKAQLLAKELSDLMDVKSEEWVSDVRATRRQASF